MLVSFYERSLNMDNYLASVYYDPKCSGGFGGVDRWYKDVQKEGKFNISRTKIKEWLMKQDAYTLHKPIRRHFKRNCSYHLLILIVNRKPINSIGNLILGTRLLYSFCYCVILRYAKLCILVRSNVK